MLEKRVESALVRRVNELGGWPIKLGVFGLPDRLCLFPGGRVVFVEVKAPGKHPRPLQVSKIDGLRRLGFDVRVIDTPGKARALS